MSKKTRYEIGMYQRAMAVGATPFERLDDVHRRHTALQAGPPGGRGREH